MLHIDKVRTSGLRPSCNGNVERINRTLGAMLTIFCEKKQKEWDTYIPQLLMAYRSSVHASTGKTPNKMVYGKEIMLPLQAVIPTPKEETEQIEVNEFVESLKERLQTAHETARKNLKKSNIYQKRHYDLKAKKRSLQAGQAVWVYEPTRKIGVCQKLTSKWKGPFIITKKLDDMNYVVKKYPKKPGKVFHIDRLLVYHGHNLPKWAKQASLSATSDNN